MDVTQFLSALLVLVLQGKPVWLQGTCDQCDCKLSSEDDARAILSVKMRCSSGTIDWSSAYGAIRLEVNPYLRGDFRFCFLAHSRHTITQVSVEEQQEESSSSSRGRGGKRRNYRLGLEGEDGGLLSRSMMKPLVRTWSSGEEGGQSREVCVVGRRGGGGRSLWLFVEVERTNRFTGIPSVTLKYDVEPLKDSALLDPLEDCRPCTQEELLEAYCTSDFVAVGTIHHTHQPEEDQENTHIQVAAAQLIHQNSPVFERLRRDDRYLYGTVHAPAKCGIRQGQGNFLFTGRMRLGKAKLRCAPFYQDWLKISAEAECVYD